MDAKPDQFKSVDFEVFGKVQKVFFRKFTTQYAVKIGVVGWVMNTSKGTVVGVAQGTEKQIAQMVKWLRETGSPKSKIEKLELTNERSLSKLEFSNFEVRE